MDVICQKSILRQTSSYTSSVVIGGFCGNIYSGTMKYCSHQGDVGISSYLSDDSNPPTIGGLVGHCSGTIEYCENISWMIDCRMPKGDHSENFSAAGGLVGSGGYIRYSRSIVNTIYIVQESAATMYISAGGLCCGAQEITSCYSCVTGLDINSVSMWTGDATYGGISSDSRAQYKANFSNSDVKKNSTITLYNGYDGTTNYSSSQMKTSAFLDELNLYAQLNLGKGIWTTDENGYPCIAEAHEGSKPTVTDPTDISVSPTSKTIKIGDTFAISYTLTPSDAQTTVTWTSDNSSIATVSSYGTVTGVNAGYTYINATTSNGKSAWCRVTVEDNNANTVSIKSINSKLGTNFIVMSDGSLWGFGLNFNGELGDGTNVSKYSPVKIMDGVSSASAGYRYSLIVKLDGSLWACGHNYYSLGDGVTTDSFYPIKIMDGVASVSAGRAHSLIVKNDGTLWAWGVASSGALGDGGQYLKDSKYTPVKIMEGVSSASAGDNFSLILRSNGELWACGSNTEGQIGDATDSSHDALYPVKMLDRVASMSASENFSMIIKTDGSLWGCGSNHLGQIGNGTVNNNIYSPVKIMDGVSSVSTGQLYSLIVKNDKSLWACGYNGEGQLGNGTTSDTVWPVKIWDNVANAAAGLYNSLILKTDGTLWGCGYIAGDDSSYNISSPVLIMNGTTNINKILKPFKSNKYEPIYNLNGQRLAQPKKGINIINGKKVVVNY